MATEVVQTVIPFFNREVFYFDRFDQEIELKNTESFQISALCLFSLTAPLLHDGFSARRMYVEIPKEYHFLFPPKYNIKKPYDQVITYADYADEIISNCNSLLYFALNQQFPRPRKSSIYFSEAKNLEIQMKAVFENIEQCSEQRTSFYRINAPEVIGNMAEVTHIVKHAFGNKISENILLQTLS